MTEIKNVTVEYIKDTSVRSDKRVAEATDLIIQMLALAKKRGRPSKSSDEVSDAA